MPRFFYTLLVLAALALSSTAFAQSTTGIPLGATLPEAARPLATAEGGQTTLREVTGQNGLAVVFWSNVCPWTERYTERFSALAREYAPAGIGFLAVNANDPARFPDEDATAMVRTAAQAGFAFPYVRDDGALARAFGARNAPQVFLFSPAGVLIYEGAIDDSPSDAARVTVPYLRQAMDQHLAGRPIEVQRTAALGCAIRTPGSSAP